MTDLGPALHLLRLPVPAGQAVVTDPTQTAGQQCLAFLAFCEAHHTPRQAAIELINQGQDAAAFHGAVEFLKAGLIDPAIPQAERFPGENWLHHLAREGRSLAAQSPSGESISPRTIGLEHRIRVLIRAGLGSRSVSAQVRTPMFVALQHDNDAMVWALRDQKTIVGTLPPINPVALLAAAQIGDQRGIKTLLARGANPLQTDGDGSMAIHFAACRGHLDIIQSLFEHAGLQVLNARDGTGTTPMHLAAVGNQPAAIRLLKKLGANLRAYDGDGNTPLHTAALHNRVLAATTLIEIGLAPDLPNKRGETPLDVARRAGSHAASRFFADSTRHADRRASA